MSVVSNIETKQCNAFRKVMLCRKITNIKRTLIKIQHVRSTDSNSAESIQFKTFRWSTVR